MVICPKVVDVRRALFQQRGAAGCGVARLALRGVLFVHLVLTAGRPGLVSARVDAEPRAEMLLATRHLRVADLGQQVHAGAVHLEHVVAVPDRPVGGHAGGVVADAGLNGLVRLVQIELQLTG